MSGVISLSRNIYKSSFRKNERSLGQQLRRVQELSVFLSFLAVSLGGDDIRTCDCENAVLGRNVESAEICINFVFRFFVIY